MNIRLHVKGQGGGRVIRTLMVYYAFEFATKHDHITSENSIFTTQNLQSFYLVGNPVPQAPVPRGRQFGLFVKLDSASIKISLGSGNER
jgi:hypothetical protein